MARDPFEFGLGAFVPTARRGESPTGCEGCASQIRAVPSGEAVRNRRPAGRNCADATARPGGGGAVKDRLGLAMPLAGTAVRPFKYRHAR